MTERERWMAVLFIAWFVFMTVLVLS